MRHVAGPEKKTGQIFAYSNLRAAACVAIVLLHTVFSAVNLFAADASALQRQVSYAISNNMMWAVPCFLMVSGALLLDGDRPLPLKKLFGKYILRVVMAIVVFCLLFRALEIFVNREPLTVETAFSGVKEMFTGTSWSHLWYLYLLVGIYLLLPFFKKMAVNSTDAELRYLLLVLVIFLSLLPALRIWNITSGFTLTLSSIYIFYFFCGYAMRRGALKIGRGTGAVITLLSTAAITAFSVWRQSGGPQSLDLLYGYSSIFVVLQSVGMFAWFTSSQKAQKAPGRVQKALLVFDACSFGVYLIHMIFVRGILKHTAIQPYGAFSPLIFAGLVLGITAVSFVLTWVLRKIPLVQKIL